MDSVGLGYEEWAGSCELQCTFLNTKRRPHDHGGGSGVTPSAGSLVNGVT